MIQKIYITHLNMVAIQPSLPHQAVMEVVEAAEAEVAEVEVAEVEAEDRVMANRSTKLLTNYCSLQMISLIDFSNRAKYFLIFWYSFLCIWYFHKM